MNYLGVFLFLVLLVAALVWLASRYDERPCKAVREAEEIIREAWSK